jgi:hypothetical protein
MGIICLMVEILGGEYLNGKQGFSCWKKCLFLVVDVVLAASAFAEF